MAQEIIFDDLCRSQFNGNYDDMVDWLNKYNCNKKVIFISRNRERLSDLKGEPFVVDGYYEIKTTHLKKILVGVMLTGYGIGGDTTTRGEAGGLYYVYNDFVGKENLNSDDTGIKWYVNGRLIDDKEF